MGNGRVALFFTDNTTLMSRGRTQQQAMEKWQWETSGMQTNGEVYSNNLLQNETKTQNKVCTLSLDYMEGSESEVKLIDQKLAWREHVQEIGKRLTRVFFLLRKLKNHLTEIYHVTASVPQPFELWFNPMWMCCKLKEVLRQQKSAVCIMTSSGNTSTTAGRCLARLESW